VALNSTSTANLNLTSVTSLAYPTANSSVIANATASSTFVLKTDIASSSTIVLSTGVSSGTALPTAYGSTVPSYANTTLPATAASTGAVLPTLISEAAIPSTTAGSESEGEAGSGDEVDKRTCEA
jgi:hypothetical protein